MKPGSLIRNARVLRLGKGPLRGAQPDVRAVDGSDVLIGGGRIIEIGQGLRAPEGAEVLDADGRVLMPGFVDAHTHLCWAGDRLDEWEQRLGGAGYLELLQAGGGIMSTVRAVRAATREQLADQLSERLAWALAEGTTTIEVKSGYGLSTEYELKMLGAIRDAAESWPGTVVPTACIGHAVDGDHDAFIEQTIAETLPAVAQAFPGITIDAYCESGAWSLDDCLRLFDRAAELGSPCRVHADQFNELGMIGAAAERGFVSVDHLEATGADGLRDLAESETFGVMLPCSGFHVDERYADGRAFLDAGGALVLATNANPGSAPCVSVPMAVALGVRHNGVTAHEALAACTCNAAALLGFGDRGFIAAGARADLVLLRHRDERELAHSYGGRTVDMTVCAGEIVSRSQR